MKICNFLFPNPLSPLDEEKPKMGLCIQVIGILHQFRDINNLIKQLAPACDKQWFCVTISALYCPGVQALLPVSLFISAANSCCTLANQPGAKLHQFSSMCLISLQNKDFPLTCHSPDRCFSLWSSHKDCRLLHLLISVLCSLAGRVEQDWHVTGTENSSRTFFSATKALTRP